MTTEHTVLTRDEHGVLKDVVLDVASDHRLTGGSGQGSTGPQGPKGDKGDKGNTGDTGAQGFTGETGPQGASGPEGPRGPEGPAGAQGIPGETGAQGETGPQGEQGPAGPKGDAGEPGQQGAKGDAGLQGPKGDKGDTGASGSAATPVYATLANGETAMGFGAPRDVVKVTPTANATYTTTVPAAGTRVTLMILTSGASSRTITFGSGFKAVGTLATGTTSGRVFCVSFASDGTNLYETARTAAMVA